MRVLFANPPAAAALRSTSQPAQIQFQRFAQAILVADSSSEREPQRPDRDISPQRNHRNLAELCATLHRDFSAFDSADGHGIRHSAEELGGNSEAGRGKTRNRSGETRAKPLGRTASGIPAGQAREADVFPQRSSGNTPFFAERKI